MTDDALSVLQARENVIALELRITGEDRVEAVARGKHGEDVLDGQPPSAADRLAAENLRVKCDAIEKSGISHCPIISRAGGSVPVHRPDRLPVHLHARASRVGPAHAADLEAAVLAHRAG